MRAVRRGYAKPETLCKLAPALMFDTEGIVAKIVNALA
jgi:hypothetical protein